MSPSADAAELIIESLHRLGIPFMIVGSFSSNIYGVERSTKDADFVIETDARIDEIRDAIAPGWKMNPQVSFETKLMTTKYEFRYEPTGFKAEIFVLSEDLHDRERFARRRRVQRGDRVAYFPTPEDVIIQKLRWARDKDRSDVKNILAVSGDGLDWAYIRSWTDRHGTTGLLDRVRSGVSVAED